MSGQPETEERVAAGLSEICWQGASATLRPSRPRDWSDPASSCSPRAARAGSAVREHAVDDAVGNRFLRA
jgi:hypothetical protein